MPESHHKRSRIFWGMWVAVLCAEFGLQSGAYAQSTPFSSENSYETGITMPLKEWNPTFKYQGVIKEVLVKEMDTVKAGQVLITQDGREDEIELEADQKLSESPAAVNSAKAALEGRKADLVSKQAEYEAKKSDYERVKKIQEGGGGNDFEVDKAKYEMDAAAAAIDAAKGMVASSEADIEKAQVDQDQAKYKAQHQRAHVEMLKIVAAEDGVVQSVNVRPGDTADPSKPTAPITVVKIDVLQVEFHLPAVQVQKLHKEQTLRVSYDKKNWQDATIKYLAPVALASADGLQTIHMDMPNPEGKAAGQTVIVELPADVVAMRNDLAAAALK